MKKKHLSYIIVLFCLLQSNISSGQQYLTERLVELTIETEAVQEYFKAFNTVFILSNDFCNNNNCRTAHLTANKKIMIMHKEDLFMRNMKYWMEFTFIKRKGKKAMVKIKLQKKGFQTLSFFQKRGQWYLE